MNPFRTRLRSRLLLVALIAAAPVVAAIVFTQALNRQRARDATLADNLRLVRLAADEQAGVFNGARNLLRTLAVLPQLQSTDPAECQSLLPLVLRSNSAYLALTVAAADGSIFCSTAPVGRLAVASALGRVWFARAMRTRTTATGDYQFSAVAGIPSIVVAHPMLDAGGRVTRIVVALIGLTELSAVMARANLPPGGILTLFDGAGTILARVPGDTVWVGHQVPDTRPLIAISAGADAYKSESAGVDGIRRLFVTVPVRAELPTNLFIGMGIDHDAAFREANRSYRAYLLSLGLVLLAGAVVAAVGVQLFVLRPVNALKAVADRLAAGDLGARAQLAGSVSGISELGDAVNAMATALDTREAALAERVAVATATADVGVALSSPRDLPASLQSCAEALVAHLHLDAVAIDVVEPISHAVERLAATGAANHGPLPARWPLVDGVRSVGALSLSTRDALSDGVAAGLRSISAIIGLGITRRHAEDGRRLLASIVESSDEAIYGWRRDGTIVSWNRGSQRLFGYTSEQILGRSVLLLYPPDRQDELPELMARVNRGEKVTDLETVRQRRDGAAVPVSLTLSPLHDAGGHVIGTSVIARDLTERRRAEATLNLLARALESTNEMVSVTDADDRFTFVNAAFLRAYDYTADEVIGQTPALIQATHTPAATTDAIQQNSRRGGWKGELRNRRRDGSEFDISLNTSVVHDEQGAIIGLLGVARDITERRALEDQLRQSQKMEAVGQLAGGVAHDFNNLLTVIQGFAGFLAESLPADDERRGSVLEIQRAAERATILTRQLLAFSRKQILDVRVLRLGDIVDGIVPMLRRLIGEGINLQTRIGDRASTRADPGQLEQVIVNLAVNARDAMRPGGQLTIDTSDVMLDPAFASVHPSVTPGLHVCLTVSDTGHGMDADTRARVFEPFFTTKPMGRGTGLGLSTVYGIVKQSGGSVWVESTVGSGTTFTVYLPATAAGPDAALPSPADPHRLNGVETVLVVEDEESVRRFVCRVLTSLGYAVHGIADPVEALAYARTHGAAFDLVVSDIVLPNMSGTAMVAQMRLDHPAVKVLLISGYADEDVIDERTMFVHKPFAADVLARKVRDVLDA